MGNLPELFNSNWLFRKPNRLICNYRSLLPFQWSAVHNWVHCKVNHFRKTFVRCLGSTVYALWNEEYYSVICSCFNGLLLQQLKKRLRTIPQRIERHDNKVVTHIMQEGSLMCPHQSHICCHPWILHSKRIVFGHFKLILNKYSSFFLMKNQRIKI